jgi:hypothetical protein
MFESQSIQSAFFCSNTDVDHGRVIDDSLIVYNVMRRQFANIHTPALPLLGSQT